MSATTATTHTTSDMDGGTGFGSDKGERESDARHDSSSSSHASAPASPASAVFRFMLLIEVLEVVRRSMWAVFRVEWECLNKNFGSLAKDARDSEEEGEEGVELIDDHR